MNFTLKVILAVGFTVTIVYLAFSTGHYLLPHTLTSAKDVPPLYKAYTGSVDSLSVDKSVVNSNRADVPTIPVIPVQASDWNETRLTYNMSEAVLQTDWWKAASFLELDFRNRPKDYLCKTITSKGNWYVCMDKKFYVSKPCLVYSFGIGNDFSFDDAMAKLGCEVHSFDPSMGVKDHIRNTSVHFHNIGLGGKVIEHFNARKDMYVRKKQEWTILTLGTIMAALGHTDRDLDVLKIDVEGHEWSVIEYLINSKLTQKIKQFSLEYHLFADWPKKSEYPKILSLYKKLSDDGFKKFHTGLHPLMHIPKKFNIQADVGYVNTLYQSKVKT